MLISSCHCELVRDGFSSEYPSQLTWYSFSARLPDLCDSLNRKLGGPVLRASPPKTMKPAKPKTVTTKQPKPGAVAKRPLLARDGKSLQRAFSNDKLQRDRRSMSRGPSKAVAALLSATETAIPGLKRENSDSLSLMSIPRMRADCGLLKSATAGSLSRSNSISGDDPRVKKKAMVEAELQDAIAALRKPNRQLAGASMVEAAEKRVSGSLSQIRSEFCPCLDEFLMEANTNTSLEQNQGNLCDTRQVNKLKSRPRRCTTDTATRWPVTPNRLRSHGLFPVLVLTNLPRRRMGLSSQPRRRERASGTRCRVVHPQRSTLSPRHPRVDPWWTGSTPPRRGLARSPRLPYGRA